MLCIASLGGGGAEHVMATLANYWVDQGVAVTLVTLDNPKQPDVYKLDSRIVRQIIFVPFTGTIFSKLVAHIRRFLLLHDLMKREQPDVVLSFMTPTNILAIAASRGLNVHCVVAERTNPELYDYGLVNNCLRNLFYQLANVVVVQTQPIARWLKRRTSANIVVVPNFLLREIPPITASPKKQILAVGRLVPEKRFDFLVSAFAKVANEFPEWSVLIMGEGSERQFLTTLIERLELTNRIHLCGFVNDPTDTLCRASIAVQPSRFEGFPNALLEAMACGLPAIATHQAGDMLIKDGINGLLVPVDDVDQLADALRRLMENPELRAYLGENALQVRETYSQERVIRLWDEVLFPSQIVNLPPMTYER